MSITRTRNPFECFDRRYAMELLPSAIAIAIAALLAVAVPRTPGIRLLIGALLSLALAYSILVTVGAIRRLDELQQRIHLIAIAVSFAVTGAVAALSLFIQIAAPRWQLTAIEIWVLMQLVWMVGVVVINRRYR